MSVKSSLVHLYCAHKSKALAKQALNAVAHQEYWMLRLVHKAQHTVYGKKHLFANIATYTDFVAHVPLTQYAMLLPYINQIIAGEANVLWPGKPLYIAKTSGTTGGYKFLPLTKEAVLFQIKAAKHCLVHYVHASKNHRFINGKMLFLQGSPALENVNGIAHGRLSGIVAHHVPWYLQTNRLPTYATNCIAHWNTKIEALVDETKHADIRLFGGIPSWLLHYFESVLHATGKTCIADVYPNLSVLIHGGVYFEPYRAKYERIFGKQVDVVETYPATEGFIAYQDDFRTEGLLLNTHAGIFFEFMRVDDYHAQTVGKRIWLSDVELHVNYVLILSTNSGLFGYAIGDTVQFVSKNPYRIVVTGRVKEYVSAFGEQVYAHQTDNALLKTLQSCAAVVNEYHVYPVVHETRHVWLIEFDTCPENVAEFERLLDFNLHAENMYYRDLVATGVIQRLCIRVVEKGGFYRVMQTLNKAGGQHKIPKLANSTHFADCFGVAD